MAARMAGMMLPQCDPDLIRGIAAYRSHPGRRSLPDPPVLWREGEIRLLDYGGTGRPALFVPSLINRSYILDLDAAHSMLRHLAGEGARVLLLDWGWPDAAVRGFGLSEYITGPLERAIVAIGAPVALVGYCMGGLLVLAAALRRPDLVRALGLLATPWDFRGHDPAQADRLAEAARMLEPVFAATGTLPIDLLQILFAALDPDGIASKYRRFGQWDPASDQAGLFVAIEDWLNDCVPVAAPVARECLAGWYGRNTTLIGEWRVAGTTIRPEALRVPSFVALPGSDRIVPPASAAVLARRLAGAEIHTLTAGHVSMVAGNGAARTLWPRLAAWLGRV